MSGFDEQDVAELYDEESRGDDETIIETSPAGGRPRGQLLAPDQGGVDETAELVATELPADDLLSPEEAALHLEDH